jgi:putative ABC transport system permease protein
VRFVRSLNPGSLPEFWLITGGSQSAGAPLRRGWKDSTSVRFRTSGSADEHASMETPLTAFNMIRLSRVLWAPCGHQTCKRSEVKIMETLLQDLSYGFRVLRKSPGFTAVAVITLALGIGANTAIFGVIESVLLRKPPYQDPQHLILIWGESVGGYRNQVSYTDVEDWRRGNNVFEDIAAYARWSAILAGSDAAQRVSAIQVSDAFFRVLRGRPLLGRLFLPDDQRDGKDQVVVIANDLWRTRFSSDPNIIGRTLRINAESYQVVGVLPQDFHSLPQSLVDGQTEIYRPAAEKYDDTTRSNRHFRAIARLRQDATLQQAQAQLSAIAAQLSQSHPRDNTGYGLRVTTMKEDLVGDVRPALLLLYAAVVFVLLIACANVANLLLARSGFREREIAVRAALGASSARLARQLITESVLLSLTGGCLGLLVAGAIIAGSRSLASHSLPAMNGVTINAGMLAFTTTVAVLAGLVVGLFPAFYGVRPSLVSSLKASGMTTVSGSRSWLRDHLVVGEVALALALLVGAGLLLRSVQHLSSVDPGFNVDSVVTSDVTLPWSKYGDTPATVRFYTRLVEGLRAQPGVQMVGLVSTLPLADFDNVGFMVEGQTLPVGRGPAADRYVVSPDYSRVMQIPLKSGRSFTDADSDQTPPVVLVNETMAHQIWPKEDALGRRIKLPPFENQPWRTVVGEVADVKQYSLEQSPTMQLYLPYRQVPWNYMTVTVRTALPSASLRGFMRKEVKNIDSDAAVSEPVTLADILSDSIESRKFTMLMLLGFAILAATLAAVGVYAVFSYLVAHRTREIGVRLALGAPPWRILTMIMRRGLGLVAAGSGLGLCFAFAASRAVASMLFEVKPHDLLTYLAVPCVLVSVALLACYVPARRATKVDPMVALRYE